VFCPENSHFYIKNSLFSIAFVPFYPDILQKSVRLHPDILQNKSASTGTFIFVPFQAELFPDFRPPLSGLSFKFRPPPSVLPCTFFRQIASNKVDSDSLNLT